jgi:uncharacterized protein YjbI with pentapeptide repeats
VFKLNISQNYQRAKLKGKSFKGQDLTGVDFSYSDIRGADFTDAILRNTNFSRVKAGLQRRWVVILVTLVLLLSAISGLLCTIGGSLLGFILLNSSRENVYIGITSSIVLFVYFLLTVRRGVAAASGFLLMTMISAAIGAVLWAGIVAVAWTGIAASTGAMELAEIVAAIVTGALAVVVVAVGLVVIAGAIAVAGAIGGLFIVIVTVAIAGAACGVVGVAAGRVSIVAGAIGIIIGVLVVLLSASVGWGALFGDKKQSLIRKVAFSLVTKYGTRFYNADLTDADFTQARLKNTNFITANITRTCWFQVHKLHLAAVEKTYLENESLQQLLVTKDLHNKNLDGWNLQGVNLEEANFQDTSLVQAKLSNANLQDADFSRANLVQTELASTDLRGATLTGAYIQDWGVTSETKLDNIKCDYIFMRVPTKDNPNPYRLPANWEEVFQTGEFTRLFSPLSRLSKI